MKKLPMQTMTLRLAAIAIAIITLTGARPSVAQDQRVLAGAKAIAEEAYLYGFPMIVGYNVMYEFFIDRNSGQFKAPINQINNEARVFTPKDTAISTPNSDTPYSMALLDLRAEPMVLCMPEIEKARYYDVQLVDLYTDNYGYMGSRTTGNGAGCYLVAGPGLEGRNAQGHRQGLPQRDAVQPGGLPHAALQSRRHGQREEGPGRLQGAAAIGLPRPARAARRAGDRLAEVRAGGLHDGLPEYLELPAAVLPAGRDRRGREAAAREVRPHRHRPGQEAAHARPPAGAEGGARGRR